MPQRNVGRLLAKKMREDSESGSNYSPAGSDKQVVSSDGGGSDYEPDEPVKIDRGKPKKEPARRNSYMDGSSGDEWGGKERGGGSDNEDSNYERHKAKK